MRVYLALVLFLAVTVYGEKKINLEDIERDNLRSETKDGDSNLRAQETQYPSKPESNQHYQHSANQHQTPSSIDLAYSAPQQLDTLKYSVHQPDEYSESEKYVKNDVEYEQRSQILTAPHQIAQPVEYYNGYQRPQVTAKTISYTAPQKAYQPEVIVGNQIQTIQQKAAATKYANNVNKDTLYVDIPVNQLLSYYPNLDPSQLPSSNHESQQLPIYTSGVNTNQIYTPTKLSYQIPSETYTPRNNGQTEAIFRKSSKTSKGRAYTPVNQQQVLTASVYAPSEASYSQPKSLLYAQTYLAQPQYVQPLVYSQPNGLYTQSQASPIYADVYAQIPSYVQDNALYSQPQYTIQYNQPQEIYLSPAAAEQLMKQIFQNQALESTPHQSDKVPAEPTTYFVPPQVPAQKFKSSVTKLITLGNDIEDATPSKSHFISGGPRSLLDSYVPSSVIAAQDSARYQERPIKLEGGFLPSKINFIQAHKKRKSE